jgi:predicted aspartyl protease
MKTGQTVVRALCASALAGLVVFAVSGKQALGADAMLQGTAFFKKKDYKNAAASYKKAMVQHPNDAAIFYYYAVCLQNMKDIKGAEAAYLDVLSRFPTSSSASYAQAAIMAIDPNLLQGATAKTATHLQTFSGSRSSGSSGSYGGGGGASGEVIPASTVVNYSTENEHMMVEMRLNGRPIKAVFDSGAENILIGRNHLAEMSLTMPPVEKHAYSTGVGGAITPIEGAHMLVSCGGLTRNVMVYVKDHMDTAPLLGAPFTAGLKVSIGNGSIRFNAPTASSGGSGSSYRPSSRSVPFKIVGHSVIVTAMVNNRPIDMCLDTGAGTTLFDQNQANAVGIVVPEGAEQMQGTGIGGIVHGNFVQGITIRLGPVEKRDMKVAVEGTAPLQHPLLGADFLNSAHPQVDYEHHVVNFD